MEGFAAMASAVGRAVGIDAEVAAGAIGVLVAAILVWLGHLVSHANARAALAAQADEKAAVIDLRDLALVGTGDARAIRFEVWNCGPTPATDVVVRQAKSGGDAFARGYAAVVGVSERPVLRIALGSADPANVLVEVVWRDHRGRRRSSKRRLSFDQAGGAPREMPAFKVR